MGISIWQLLILLAVVILIFGTKKLKNIGGDLGGAIKGFKSAVKEGDDADAIKAAINQFGNLSWISPVDHFKFYTTTGC